MKRIAEWEGLPGAMLLGAALIALGWANSPWSGGYEAFCRMPIGVRVGPFAPFAALQIVIDDLLMAVFFLQVGLEIKFELTAGRLKTARAAATPAIAATGGMIVPIAIYAAIAGRTGAAHGWGVAMATDIAFALGVMRALGSRVPPAATAFLTALAIIDDLGAILVIGLFYGETVSPGALGAAAAATAALIALNWTGVRRLWPYLTIGAGLWCAVAMSGVHPTIAGVILAMCVPGARRASVDGAGDFLAAETHPDRGGDSPLRRLEHLLNPWVNFAILPIFALANAGLSFGGLGMAALASPAAMGTALGLLIGKPVGVIGATLLAVRMGVGELPDGMAGRTLSGLGMLAGIGFTMSLFIAQLAFGFHSAMLEEAKLAILAGSSLSALAGALVLSLGDRGSRGRRLKRVKRP
jgi:NhaA family Na+:H+ antiporter